MMDNQEFMQWTEIEYIDDNGKKVIRGSDNFLITGSIYANLIQSKGPLWVQGNVTVVDYLEFDDGSFSDPIERDMTAFFDTQP